MRAVVWGVGVVLAGAVGVLVAIERSNDGTGSAEAAGAGTGAVVAGVLVGLIVRFAYVRLAKPGDRRILHPFVLLAGALVALVTLLGDVGAEATACTSGSGPDAASLVTSGPTTALPADVVDRVRNGVAADFDSLRDASAVTVDDSGVVVVVLSTVGEVLDGEEFLRGFESGATGSRPLSVAGGEGVIGSAPDGSVVATGLVGDCTAVVVAGTDEAAIERVAEALRG